MTDKDEILAAFNEANNKWNEVKEELNLHPSGQKPDYLNAKLSICEAELKRASKLHAEVEQGIIR